ncbi:ELMO domain-containing protein C [Durusdinium trenchii]|uniref:ELMO domain-containing protein C n=1 Tax=Durusdinium trenchii TaxID=1381693 RepID=A0ABP0QBJ2_9DINO
MFRFHVNFPPGVALEAPLEDKKLPDEEKTALPRPYDRYHEDDGALDVREIQAAIRKEEQEEISEDANLLAKERLANAQASVNTNADEQRRARHLTRDAEAAEARTPAKSAQGFSYKTSSPVTAPAPTFAAAVSPAPAATAEPKKITMEEAQKGVYVPGEIEPSQTRMYDPRFHM